MTLDRQTAKRIPAAIPDVVVENVVPMIDGGRFAAKAVVGDTLAITADVFGHGHDLVRAKVRFRRPGERKWNETPMTALGNDAYAGSILPEEVGTLEVEVAGAPDEV
ncbi:MAG TPA: maltotransferase domain-containing protein, partial [Acidimicrobiales bacterium]|nr:maltotransferase domain-containing protein [Acidimicrobiales bacterium]